MDAPLPSRTISVLHLEDSPLDAELASEMLAADGLQCEVKRVWTRDQFEEALLGQPRFDLILADHNLPAFDGETALTIAASVAPDISFIFLSGTLGEDVAVEAMKRGATDYVVKQKMERLPRVVRRALQEVEDRDGRRKAEAALRRTEQRFRDELEDQVEQRTAALLEAEHALQQTQKMDAIGNLTGGVAHDFNNLLSVVLGSLEMLRRKLPNDPELQRLLDNALAGAQRGASLTKRMLAFARQQDLQAVPVDVRDLTRGMAELMQRSLGPMITLDIWFPDALPAIAGDPNQLETALLNLALNGRDAMAGRGQIAISARTETLSQPTGHRAAGAYVVLAVTDSGTGMDSETLAKATEPFFTTKGVGKGTGLGLSMVQGLAQQSQGELVLRSELGKGTTAEIWLPVMTNANAVREPAPSPTVSSEPDSRSLRILAVDDDALVLLNTVDMLEELGHQVTSVESGKTALDLLEKQPFDFLITDHAMPHMTGAELARAARERFPSLPILLATGYAELPPGTDTSLARLSKPFTQIDLAKAVQSTLTASA